MSGQVKWTDGENRRKRVFRGQKERVEGVKIDGAANGEVMDIQPEMDQ